jgi:DNA-binding transcriptional ArsR family regulator
MEDSDKFILVSLNDESSKSLSEILGNKTCKKIIDFLSERKEASEKDISDGLKIPLNTAEYNLSKLLKSGLVKKTNNFFWSVKGKKIPMYKLANKHIVISPSKKPNPESLKFLIPVFAGILIGLFIMGFYNLYISEDNLTKSFNSLDEFSFTSESGSGNYPIPKEQSSFASIDSAQRPEYDSTINSIVKYDRNYVYVISEDKIVLFENVSGELIQLSEVNLSELYP